MKTITKIFGIIAIGAVIAAGLSACVTAPPLSEEELALISSLENATWKKERLDNPPALDGFEKISKMAYKDTERMMMEEAGYFQRAASPDGERSAGRTITMTRNGVESSFKAIGMDTNTWYRLTAPEFPNVTYYCYRESKEGSVRAIFNTYKSKQ